LQCSRSRSPGSWWKRSNTTVTVYRSTPKPTTGTRRPRCRRSTSTSCTGTRWSTWPRSSYRTRRSTTRWCTSTPSTRWSTIWRSKRDSRPRSGRTTRSRTSPPPPNNTGSGTTTGTTGSTTRRTRRTRRRTWRRRASRKTDGRSGTRSSCKGSWRWIPTRRPPKSLTRTAAPGRESRQSALSTTWDVFFLLVSTTSPPHFPSGEKKWKNLPDRFYCYLRDNARTLKRDLPFGFELHVIYIKLWWRERTIYL